MIKKKAISLIVSIFAVVALCGCPFQGNDGSDGTGGKKGDIGRTGRAGASGFVVLPCDKCVDNASLDDGAVTTDDLANRSVQSSNIKDFSISSAKIKNGSVTSGKFEDGAVTADQIGTAQLTQDKIATGAITSFSLADNAIVAGHLQPLAGQSCDVANNAVLAGNFAPGAITAGKIATGAVLGTNIVDNAISSADIITGALNNFWTVKGPNDTSTGTTGWAQIPNMRIDFTANGGAYLIIFNGGFYSSVSNADAQVRLYLNDGATVLSTKRLPSEYQPNAMPVCWQLLSHDHAATGQRLGGIEVHWAGELSAGDHTVLVQWRNGSGTLYQGSGDGMRNLAIIEFTTGAVDKY